MDGTIYKSIEDNGLEDRAVCLGQYPFKAMPAFMKQADASTMTRTIVWTFALIIWKKS